MDELEEKLKIDTGNSSDFIYKKIIIKGTNIMLVFNDVLTSSENINQFILKNIATTIDDNLPINTSIYNRLFNTLPGNNIKKINTYPDLLDSLYNGYAILIIDKDNIMAIEVRASLDRGIPDATSEQSIQGPKDAFTENFNKNLGLIRKRLKSNKLWLDDFNIGSISKTKVGILYIKNIAEDKLIKEVTDKLNKINIDGIIDSGYIKEMISNDKQNFFPTIMATERPDQVSMALLEGKIAIIVDNSPYVLIIPCFLIDLFHTADDYYQKQVNISFIRIIRLLAFIIAIFVPAYYIAVTTHNHDALSLDLLINFAAQREMVPFPALVEALLMSITFEILRESDTRMPSSMGTAVSILGGLVLGDAAVSAGIVSPIMIIVIAISAISGLLFSEVELISAIRWWRFILMFLATILGIYGVFIGTLLLISKLASLKSFGKPYLTPFAPYLKSEQQDALIKYNKTKKKYRNPYLTKTNLVRGDNYQED
ncbi:MAG: spore germination protein [Bacilli bacterium]